MKCCSKSLFLLLLVTAKSVGNTFNDTLELVVVFAVEEVNRDVVDIDFDADGCGCKIEILSTTEKSKPFVNTDIGETRSLTSIDEGCVPVLNSSCLFLIWPSPVSFDDYDNFDTIWFLLSYQK